MMHNFRRAFCILSSILLSLFGSCVSGQLTLAADTSNASENDDTATKPVPVSASDQAGAAAPELVKPSAIAPLKGYAKHDARGTPVVPEWKMQAGYDELLGKFYVGIAGLKLFGINGPPPTAILGTAQLKQWKGHKPHPCLLKFTKLQDTTGGYYFNSIGCSDGPRGWIIPQPQEPHKTREWAIYFMQEEKPSN